VDIWYTLLLRLPRSGMDDDDGREEDTDLYALRRCALSLGDKMGTWTLESIGAALESHITNQEKWEK